MNRVDRLRRHVRLLAGEIANLHSKLDYVYNRNELDPRLPWMRDELDLKLNTHCTVLQQLERLDFQAEQEQERDKRFAEYVRYRCAKVLSTLQTL